MESSQSVLPKIRKAADEESIFNWGMAGFFFSLFGVLIAYARSPRMPTRLLTDLDKEGLAYSEAAVLEEMYSKRLKARQVKAVWTGLGIGWAAGILIAVLMIAGTTSRALERNRTETIDPTMYLDRIVTTSEYIRIERGMTYPEVVEIIGAEASHKGPDPAGKSDLYAWSNSDGSRVSAFFSDGRLTLKFETGL